MGESILVNVEVVKANTQFIWLDADVLYAKASPGRYDAKP
jgi:hypothetical protein